MVLEVAVEVVVAMVMMVMMAVMVQCAYHDRVLCVIGVLGREVAQRQSARGPYKRPSD